MTLFLLISALFFVILILYLPIKKGVAKLLQETIEKRVGIINEAKNALKEAEIHLSNTKEHVIKHEEKFKNVVKEFIASKEILLEEKILKADTKLNKDLSQLDADYLTEKEKLIDHLFLSQIKDIVNIIDSSAKNRELFTDHCIKKISSSRN